MLNFKDLDLKILSELTDRDLLSFCLTGKEGKKLCDNETFWRNRTLEKHGRIEKKPNRSWKDLYLAITYYSDKYLPGRALKELSQKGMKNIDLINFFLLQGAKPNRGLFGAAFSGDMDLVRLFISLGVNDWANGLFGSIHGGHKELTDFFLKKDINVNDRNIAAGVAAQKGDLELVKYFINQGFNDWNWGLMKASQGGHQDLVDFFIEKGSDNWNFGLSGATLGGHKDLIDFFIKKGAKNMHFGLISAIETGNFELVDFFLNKIKHDLNWDTYLSPAVMSGNKEMIDFVISKGANQFAIALRMAKRKGEKHIIDYINSKI